MSKIDTLYSQLKSYMDDLKITFIDKYLNNPLANNYELDTRAYCVLAHAALEEYFEQVAVSVINECITKWQYNGKISDSLIAISIHFLLIEENRKKAENAIKKDPLTVQDIDDFLKAILKLGKDWFIKYAKDDNHGAGVKYLKKLLEPLGINISNDPIQISSLELLVTRRGDVAHTFSKKITVNYHPKNFLITISDCLDLCEEIRVIANQKII